MKKFEINSGVRKVSLAVGLAALLVTLGCGTTPRKETGEYARARKAYSQAQSHPKTEVYAAVPMHEAGKALDRAEKEKKVEERRHFAYLAERYSQLAVAVAERRIAEEEIESLREQQRDLVLELRQREAEKAEKRASMARLEADQAKRELRELRRDLAELEARRTDRGIVLTLGSVLFATDKADLMPGARRSIEKLADFLKKHPTRNIQIEGHTDSTGSEVYNLALSERRTDAVRMALISRGIDPDRITTRGYGEYYPVASNYTAAGRQQNRRVEVIILD